MFPGPLVSHELRAESSSASRKHGERRLIGPTEACVSANGSYGLVTTLFLIMAGRMASFAGANGRMVWA
jgi:hypothetical protein